MKNKEFVHICAPIIEQARQLASHHAHNRSSPRPIIAVAGGSGVGKSYFSESLQQTLQHNGYQTAIINQNGFSPYNKTNPHRLINVQPEQVHEYMKKIINTTSELSLPFRIRHDKPYQQEVPHTIVYKTIDFSHVDLVIFEGSLTLSTQAPYDFFKYAEFGIFIDASQEHMKQWKTERELSKPADLQRPAEIFQEKLHKGIEVYQSLIASTKQHARFVIYKENKDVYTLLTQEHSMQGSII